MKRLTSTLLTVAMSASLFAGCATTAPAPADSQTSAQPSAQASKEPVKPEDMKGSFVWWSFFDQTAYMKEKFNEVYKNIDIDLQIFGGNEYQTKLMTTIASGSGIPDLMDLEEGYVYKFIESDVFADLGAMGGNELVKDYYPWCVALGTDSKGTLKGISDNVSPVAFWYVRDAAEKWLGTSDDVEISNMLSDWDKIIEVAKKVKEESDGKVFLWPNLGEITKVEGYSITPFVRDGKFAIDQKWFGVIDTMRTLWDEKLVADLGSWSGEWSSAWNAGELLIRCMPSWDFFTSNDNKGKVGVAKPPKNSYEGGTFRAVYDKSKNKDLAMEMIKFLTTVDYQIGNLNDNNQMPATKLVYETIGKDYSSENFGGQNILKTYNEICENIPSIIPDQYTRDAQNMFSKHASEGVKKGLTNDQIIENFKKELKDKYPEIQGL